MAKQIPTLALDLGSDSDSSTHNLCMIDSLVQPGFTTMGLGALSSTLVDIL